MKNNPRLRLHAHKLANFTYEQEDIFMTKVAPLLEKVVNSEEFKEEVLKYTWEQRRRHGPWWRRRYSTAIIHQFKKSNGKTNFQVYNELMSGADVHNTIADGDIDLYLTLYYSRKSVIGYTYPSTFKTWVNRKFFNRWLKSREGHCSIIGNIVHEYMHNLGYGHSFRWNSTREHTVPYAVGYIARSVALRIVRRESNVRDTSPTNV